MVKVRLPKEVKGKELLDLLEESSKELGYKTKRDDIGGCVIVPGSVKEELTKTTLTIESYIQKQYSNNLWGKIKKFICGEKLEFVCELPISLDYLYKGGEALDFEVGVIGVFYQPIKTGTQGWEMVKERFEKLIDKLYTKLGYSPKTQENISLT